MKKRMHWVTALALLLFGVGQASAGSVTVGTGSSGNCYPFLCNDSGTNVGPSIHYQQVYASSAFPSGTFNIGSLQFYFAPQFGGNSTMLHGTYDISFSTTSAAVGALSSALANNIGTPLQTFFIGDVSQAPVGGTYTIVGSTPYLYNPGLGNLLIDIAVSNQDNVPNGSGNGYNQSDPSGSVTSRAYAFNGNASGSADPIGLVTTFITAGPSVPEPASLSLATLGLGCLFGYALRRRKLAAK